MLLILVLNYFRSLDIIQWLVVVWVSVVPDSHMKGTITWEQTINLKTLTIWLES